MYGENGAKNRKITTVKVQNDAHWIQLKSQETKNSRGGVRMGIVGAIAPTVLKKCRHNISN